MTKDLEEFITKLEQKLQDYEMDLWERLDIETATCDIHDVYNWIDEVKKEMGIEDE